MSYRYQVKFVRDGVTFYGIADLYHADWKQYAVDGNVLVEEAVTGKKYVVPDAELVDIEMSGFRETGDEYQRHVHTEFQRAHALSEANPADGKVRAGDMFAIGVGDGHAYYVVTKVHRKNCDVEWRGFGGDRYTDHHFGHGGRFPVADVKRYIRKSMAWR